MSTSTMMSNHHRRFPTPGFVDPTFKKRKERESECEGFETLKSPKKKPVKPPIVSRPGSTAPGCPKKNHLLAGYLAYEFLSKESLFGKPAGSEAGSGDVDLNKRYAEVADLLKTDETHLPGVVNPAQLAQFLQP